MATRNKNRRTAATSGSRSGSLLWLSIGMILGGIAVGMFFVKLVVPRTLQNSPLANNAAQQEQVATSSVKPRFDFYTMLPEMEVAVSQEAPTATATNKAPTTTPEEQAKLAASLAALQPKKNSSDVANNLAASVKPQTEPARQAALPAPLTETKQPGVAKESYILQLASFKNFSDADQLKAKLSLLGYNVSIQTINGANGEKWHRVRSGPYAQLSQAEQHRQQLQQQHINSILLKLPG